MFAATCYDAVYLYVKLATEALARGDSPTQITDGERMFELARNYHTLTGRYCFTGNH